MLNGLELPWAATTAAKAVRTRAKIFMAAAGWRWVEIGDGEDGSEVGAKWTVKRGRTREIGRLYF